MNKFVDKAAEALFMEDHPTATHEEWLRHNPTSYHRKVRAVIAAMRECTDEMNDAGADKCDGGEAEKSCHCGFMGKIWTAMIDAALKP